MSLCCYTVIPRYRDSVVPLGIIVILAIEFHDVHEHLARRRCRRLAVERHCRLVGVQRLGPLLLFAEDVTLQIELLGLRFSVCCAHIICVKSAAKVQHIP